MKDFISVFSALNFFHFNEVTLIFISPNMNIFMEGVIVAYFHSIFKTLVATLLDVYLVNLSTTHKDSG